MATAGGLAGAQARATWRRVAGIVLAAVSGGRALSAAPADFGSADDVTVALEAIRAKSKAPALGAALFTTDRLDGVWVAGRRAADVDVAVATDDLWHLGSCTKSMTATLIALLVERGDLRFDTPLAKLLPDCATSMQPAYADLTLVELLAHRAGLPAMTGPDPLFDSFVAATGELPAIRADFTRRLLEQAPASPPRGPLVYSNAGFVVAGHVAEVAIGKSWEELITELLFVPLGMASAGFGAPGFPDELLAPRGHDDTGGAIEPGPDGDNPPWLGPAGVVHATLADWAKYLQLHLRGVQGDVTVGAVTLRKETFTRLRTAWSPAPSAAKDGAAPAAPATDDTAYGYGWLLPRRDWAAGDHLVLTHTGSNGLWFCCCWLDPAAGFGVVATTNCGGVAGSQATDAAAALLLQRHLTPAREAKSGD